MTAKRHSQYPLQHLILLGMLVFFLTGCVSLADPETSQVHQSDIIYTLQPDSSSWVEQSFISRREGLNGITIHVASSSNDSASTLMVELFHYPAKNQPIFSTRVAVRNGPIRINLPALKDPANSKYLLKLSSEDQGLQIMGRSDDIYAYGDAYANDGLMLGDLAFSTTYEYNLPAFLEDLKNALPGVYLVIPLFAVLFLPGFFTLNMLKPDEHLDLGELMALSVGLSLAILPLVMLWTGLVGFSWGAASLTTASILLALGSVILSWRKKFWRKWRLDFFDLFLILVFSASLVVRLVMIRDMAGTAWVDSVHHGLVTRLILDHGTLPTTFTPYFEISPTDYHPGFHVGVAGFTWLSRLDMDRAMLLYGQVLNALAIFAVYSFTKTLTQSKLAALVAALATGLCTPMPAYYTTWGRYTQLAGLLVLPVPLALFHHGLKDKFYKWQSLALACLAASGLILVHYRVMAFLVILMGLYYLIYVLFDRSKWALLIEISLSALICIAAVTLLSIPWLAPTITETILPLSAEPTASVKWFSDFSWRLLNTALGQPVMAFSVFGLVAGLLLGDRLGYLIALWIGALFLLANPSKIGLPTSFLNNTSVAIFLFMPMSALAGYAVDLATKACQVLAPKLYRPFMAGLALVGLIVGYQGMQRILPILNSGTILLRQADLPALKWAEQNIPKEATVAINPFAWGYGLYAGSDGGFWLAPIAGVRTMPPPVLSAMEGWEENTAISKKLIELGRDPSNLADFLRNNGINYIYLGARGGVISPIAVKTNPQFQTLYHANGVWIFKLIE